MSVSAVGPSLVPLASPATQADPPAADGDEQSKTQSPAPPSPPVQASPAPGTGLLVNKTA
jgi:hypothetical protein